MNKAIIVVGLGFGDEGKGSIVDFLCREQVIAPVVVRFNGGSQAAHNVITPDGRHHTFAQFGSGMFVPNTLTHLSSFSLVDLFALDREAHALAKLGVGDPYARLSIDERAKIITPFQKAANRLREALRKDRHGSCGMGIGETMADSLANPPLLVQASDLLNCDLLTEKLEAIQRSKFSEFQSRFKELNASDQLALRDEITMLHDKGAPRLFAEAMCALAGSLTIAGAKYLRTLAEDHPLIFEGAQGVLLD
ncbi:MAG: adenylosuccinate synthetase, partial [Planctomycetota bacterium]|nr:adenylosuccinate synthetase [Planctomycetota bacterium]